METIKTIDLCKRYGDKSTGIDALKNVNLTVKAGSFVSVIGASGSGKSTLLHLLGALDKPSSGSIYIDGEDVSKKKENELAILRRRKFGFVFQAFNLIPVLTVEENITLPLLLDGRVVDKEYINELMELLGLSDRKRHLPNNLSGGQQQRVAIGRSLANKPSIIFADEPTGNLDSKTGSEVIDLLRLSSKRFHQSLLIITHDMKIAESADRIITISDGQIAEDREGLA